MKHLSDRDVRQALGHSLRDAAKWAGVAKNTLALYEQAPHVVRVDVADRLRAFYVVLRAHHVELEAFTRR